MCVNSFQGCYNALIREKRINVDKETKERKEKWKDQVEAKQKHQDVQLKSLTINKNKVTVDIIEKWKETSKLNKRIKKIKE